MAKEQHSPDWLAAWAAIDVIEQTAKTVKQVNEYAAAEIVTVAIRARRHLMEE